MGNQAIRNDTGLAELRAEFRERMAKSEWKAEAMEERLSQGAESFSDLRASIGEVRKDLREAHDRFSEAIAPKPIQTWKIIGTMFGVLCVATSLIWMFARYPDREEFNATQLGHTKEHKELKAEIGKVAGKQGELASDQRLIKASVASTDETMKRIDESLAKLAK